MKLRRIIIMHGNGRSYSVVVRARAILMLLCDDAVNLCLNNDIILTVILPHF